MKNARNILLTGLVLIAAVLGIGVWKGVIPPRAAGTEGAIGAAQRYSSPQISDGDVQLTDPSVQAFLQSDLFHTIAINPDFQKLISKEAFKNAVKVDGLLNLVASDFGRGGAQDFQQVLASEDMRNVTASADFRKAIKDQKVQDMLRNEDFRNLVASADFKNLAEKLRDAKTSGKDARNILKDENSTKTKEWKALSANTDFNAVLANQDFLAAAANTDLAKIIKDNGKAFANADFGKALASDDFQKLVASPDFQKMAASPEFRQLTASADFRQLAANQDFQRVAKGDLAAAVAASADMKKNQAAR